MPLALLWVSFNVFFGCLYNRVLKCAYFLVELFFVAAFVVEGPILVMVYKIIVELVLSFFIRFDKFFHSFDLSGGRPLCLASLIFNRASTGK